MVRITIKPILQMRNLSLKQVKYYPKDIQPSVEEPKYKPRHLSPRIHALNHFRHGSHSFIQKRIT